MYIKCSTILDYTLIGRILLHCSGIQSTAELSLSI